MTWRTLLLCAAVAAWDPAFALSWSSPPAHGGGAHGHGGHGGARDAGYRLQDTEGATVELWLPTLEKRPLTVAEDGSVKVKPTGIDYYHALVARRGDETAVRYITLRGKPSKRSPSELMEAAKAPLELVPTPYLREHQRYLTSKRAVFELLFEGKPVPSHTVSLTTGNGTRLFANTDAAGRVAFPLPEDFADVEPGRRANAPADFTVGADYQGHRFSLTAQYYVNPRHWQSVSAGLWTGLAGFVAGLALLGMAGRRSGRAAA